MPLQDANPTPSFGGFGLNGPCSSLCNVISANGQGVALGLNGTGNVIRGNHVGTDVSGALAMGNGSVGVVIEGSSNNTVGGPAELDGNIVAHNTSDGVTISPGSTGNSVLSNSTYQNSGLGIEIGYDGSTPNDTGDADSGANNLQNSPEIVQAQIYSSGYVRVVYEVDSAPGNSAYPLLVQFFKADADGQEGKTLLASDSYPAGSAQGTKLLTLGTAAALGVVAGDLILATASDAAGNTSEFSSSSVLVANPASVPSMAGYGIVLLAIIFGVALIWKRWHVIGPRRRAQPD